jgi:hypothetical protein
MVLPCHLDECMLTRADNFDTTRHEHDTKLAGLGQKRVNPFCSIWRVVSVTRQTRLFFIFKKGNGILGLTENTKKKKKTKQKQKTKTLTSFLSPSALAPPPFLLPLFGPARRSLSQLSARCLSLSLFR